RLAVRLFRHHDADTDRARCLLPIGDDIAHSWIIWVDRLDDREPTGMGPLHFHRITRVVAVHGKGGDEDRAVDADLVHRRHHLITRDVIGPVRHTVPGSLRCVRLISVDLGIDDRHRTSTLVVRELGIATGRTRRVQDPYWTSIPQCRRADVGAFLPEKKATRRRFAMAKWHFSTAL